MQLLSMLVFLAVFGVVGGGGFAWWLWRSRDERRAVSRLRSLSQAPVEPPADHKAEGLAKLGLPQAGRLVMGQATEDDPRRGRMVQAGFYAATSLPIFLGCRLILLCVLPGFTGLMPYLLGWFEVRWALMGGLAGIALAWLGPNLWLSWMIARRQRRLRAALPDALDMLVLCLEGGVSLAAAMQRVTEELPWVHPELAREMTIVQRDIDMGLAPGEALKRFGERCQLEDLRELASLVLQAERFGGSVAKSLRVHADTWRQERQQYAEERAQKAGVKILFPMLLCIFPAIFLVTLGPAALQLTKLFSR